MKLFILSFVLLSLTSCGVKKPATSKMEVVDEFVEKEDRVLEDVLYLLDKPHRRVNNKQKYFGHEYRKISIRRSYKDSSKFRIYSTNKKPKNMIGLGFSGGGIRANAFHLGVLAGLHNIKIAKNSSMIDKIDYISSVSGGSWANGAYWINRVNDELFFRCFDEIATDFYGKGKLKCDRYKSALRYEQFQVITRGLWLEAIKKYSLMGDDLRFSELKDRKYRYLQTKPYPIFNVTHSAYLLENSTAENFPFEITPDYFGTIVDCGSGRKYCNKFRTETFKLLSDNLYGGFFVKQKGTGVRINRELYFETKQNEIGDNLSKALHVSSAVIGKLLSMDFNIRYKNNDIDTIRETYTLSDGGKSDNLGLLALVERGVDLIIISQISADPELEFEDLEISKKQVKKLLGRDVNIDKFIKKGKKISLLEKGDYSYNGKKEGKILFIKPTIYNVKKFYNYLTNLKDRNGEYIYPLVVQALREDKIVKKEWMKSKYNEVKDFLSLPKKEQENLTQFPQTPTFQVKYPQHLIYAYYLLGKYIVKNHLKNELLRIK